MLCVCAMDTAANLKMQEQPNITGLKYPIKTPPDHNACANVRLLLDYSTVGRRIHGRLYFTIRKRVS